MSTEMRTCKGECKKTLPVTIDNFYLRTIRGEPYIPPMCRACEKKKAKDSRKAKYSTEEGKKVIAAQNRNWRDNDPEYTEKKRLEQNAKYANSPEFRKDKFERTRIWRALNPEQKRIASAAWHQRTKKRSTLKNALFATFYPDLKLRGVVRRAVCEAMKTSGGSKKGRSVLQHLPYTMQELRAHLESLWEPWMSWANYGPWRPDQHTWCIDHVTPQAALPYSDFSDANFLVCWALSNLRPLESVANMSKGSRPL